MQAAVGGNIRYPNLQSIADLFRGFINDTANNTGGSGTGTGNGAGLIMSNTNPDLLSFMDSSIREIYSDLRNVGDPELILDNYILTGLPTLAQPDPAVQVSLAYSGFFDGFQWHSQWTLPIGVTRVLALWERLTNTQASFNYMTPSPFGLPNGVQGPTMGYWEIRQGQIWMPGALQSVDLKIRARMTFPDFLNPATLNFSTAYVPILDSGNAIAAKMRILYATRFAPEQYQLSMSEENRLMDKLKLEVVRDMQKNENSRAEYGAEATTDFVVTWGWML